MVGADDQLQNAGRHVQAAVRGRVALLLAQLPVLIHADHHHTHGLAVQRSALGAGAECLIQIDGIVNAGHIVAAQVILHLAQRAGEGILRAVGLQVAGQRHPQQQHAGRVLHRNALGNDGAQTVRGLFDLHPAACGVQRGHRSHLIQRLQSSRVQQTHAGVCEGHAVKQLRQSCHLCLQLVKGVVLFHVAS